MEKSNLPTLLMGIYSVAATLKQSGYPSNDDTELACDRALLGTYLREMKTYVHTETCP